MKRVSTLLILGIIALLVGAGYTGYLLWKKSSSQVELKRVEKTLSGYEEKVLQYENNRVVEAMNAKKTIDTLEESVIKWSEVIKKIQKTIPSEGNDLMVDVLSYSGSSGNDISMNVKTKPKSENPYFDTADLIKAFDDSSSFDEPFVPSIASGTDEGGSEILSFVLSIKYVKEDILKNLPKEEVPVEDLGTALESVVDEAVVR